MLCSLAEIYVCHLDEVAIVDFCDIDANLVVFLCLQAVTPCDSLCFVPAEWVEGLEWCNVVFINV